MKKKVVSALIVLAMTFSLMAGCGSQEQEQEGSTETTAVQEEKTEEEAVFTEKDLADAVSGLDDCYVLQDAKEIDFTKGIEFDKDLVKAVRADAAEVDLTKTGSYEITYTVTVYEEALEQYLKDSDKEGRTEKKADEDTADKVSDQTTDVKVTKKVTVVTKEKAQELADQGKTVWKDKNVAVAKTKTTDGKKEAAKEGEKSSGSSSSGTNSSGTSNSSTKTNGSQSSQKTASNSSKPSSATNTGNNQQKPSSVTNTNTNAGTNSNTNTNTNTDSKPAHTHDWVEQTKTIHHDAIGHNEQYLISDAWTETVTEEVYDPWECCNVCGADCTGDGGAHMEAHALAGEGGGRHTEYYKTVTNTVYHEAEYGTRWVEDTAAYDETVVTGYKCSCGATK